MRTHCFPGFSAIEFNVNVNTVGSDCFLILIIFYLFTVLFELAALAQMVACLPLVQQVRGSIPGGVVNFNLKIFNLGAGYEPALGFTFFLPFIFIPYNTITLHKQLHIQSS